MIFFLFQMQVLTLLSFIIERVGWEIAPYFDSLVNYLPLLWQHSVGHNMLRCAIVSVLTQIVKVRTMVKISIIFMLPFHITIIYI